MALRDARAAYARTRKGPAVSYWGALLTRGAGGHGVNAGGWVLLVAAIVGLAFAAGLLVREGLRRGREHAHR